MYFVAMTDTGVSFATAYSIPDYLFPWGPVPIVKDDDIFRNTSLCRIIDKAA
jgi:hypothetical protein